MFITIAPQTGIKTLPALIEAAKQSRAKFPTPSPDAGVEAI